MLYSSAKDTKQTQLSEGVHRPQVTQYSPLHSMAQDFPFVNVSETLAIDKQSRLAIRSQVSKDFHRRARTGHVEPSVPANAGHQLHRFRLKSKQTKTRRTSEPELEGSEHSIERSIRKEPPASKTLVNTPIRKPSPLEILRTANATLHEKDSNTLSDYVNVSMTLANSPTFRFPDPFETLCIPSSPQIQYFLHHCEAILFLPLSALLTSQITVWYWLP